MFRVGQKVVCKNSDGINNYFIPKGLVKGKVYTIEAISMCVCGKELLELEEAPKLERWCGTKMAYTGINSSFYSYRFEPLIDTWTDELLMRIKKEVEAEQLVLI